MQLEYKVWNIHTEWQPLSATTLEGAVDELGHMGPYTEEAQVRDKETGQVYTRQRPAAPQLNFGPNPDITNKAAR